MSEEFYPHQGEWYAATIYFLHPAKGWAFARLDDTEIEAFVPAPLLEGIGSLYLAVELEPQAGKRRFRATDAMELEKYFELVGKNIPAIP